MRRGSSASASAFFARLTLDDDASKTKRFALPRDETQTEREKKKKPKLLLKP